MAVGARMEKGGSVTEEASRQQNDERLRRLVGFVILKQKNIHIIKALWYPISISWCLQKHYILSHISSHVPQLSVYSLSIHNLPHVYYELN